jgi:glycosyltransferase involved in cell wall biosynthesis
MADKILVLTTEPLPLPGMATTGAGLRAWSLAFGLRAAGHSNVVLAHAADATRGREAELPTIPGIERFERGQLDDFIAGHAPRSIVFQHWGLMREMRREPSCPVAVDLAGPHLLERRLWNSPDPAADLREKIAGLARADFVVCSGAFQRHYFLPFLIQAGHDPRANLCPVIPFSMSPDLPEPAADREWDTFIFSGMFLPWQDPEATLRTLVETLEEKGRGRLLFIGGPHPSGDVSQGRFDALQEWLQKSSRVECHRVMPFDQLVARMRRAGAAVDLMPRNAERELAFPTRTVTMMWAGLPVIHNNYDELAEPIDRHRAGWALDPEDMGGLGRLVARLLSHREDIQRRSENARQLVASQYTWDKTITPLARWCESPKVRAGKQPLVAVPVDVTAAAPAAEAAPVARRPRRRRAETVAAPVPAMTDTQNGRWYLAPAVFLLALPISAVLVFLMGLAEIVRMALGGRRTH